MYLPLIVDGGDPPPVVVAVSAAPRQAALRAMERRLWPLLAPVTLPLRWAPQGTQGGGRQQTERRCHD